jgi:tRNA(His) guanylyltransferase
MDSDQFEERMREFEYFHSLRLLPSTWSIVRVDGRSFSRFTESRFEKPIDSRFRDIMVRTAQSLLKEMHAIYAYTESDEISLLLSPDWDLFDRELEKTVSISAGIASAAFTHACGEPAHFDSRVWLGTDKGLVIDYFQWRQSDAARCALNGWCYWTLRNSGQTIKEATEALVGKSVSYKNELLFQHGVNFNALPVWQRRGIGLYWEEYEKEGFNPVTRSKVLAVRRRVRTDLELPMKDDYSRFLRQLMKLHKRN